MSICPSIPSKLSLSVALASYNGERYIREQLDSIASQTRLPDELVISDDASVDSTRQMIEDFARSAPFQVRLLRNTERQGAIRNFETAIRACIGDIIFLCDQDDVWYPAKVAVMEDHFIKNRAAGAVFSDGDVVDESLRPFERMWKVFKFRPKEQAMMAAGDALGVLFKHPVVTGAAMAFRASYRELVLPLPELPYTWHDEWIALLIAGISNLEPASASLIAYRQHGSNQVGIPGNRSKKRRNTFKQLYGPRLARLEAVRTRLLERNDCFPVDPQKMLRFDDALTFLRACAALPVNRLQRVPITLHELTALRYHRYAKGLRSLRKDLLRGS